jgi:hypothetical protein
MAETAAHLVDHRTALLVPGLDRRTQPGDYVSVGRLEIVDDTLRAAIVPLPERWQELERERFGVRNA